MSTLQHDPLTDTAAKLQQEEKPRVSAIWLCEENDSQVMITLDGYLKALSSLPSTCDLTVVGNETSVETVTHLMPSLQKHNVPVAIVNLHGVCDDAASIQAGLEVTSGEVVAILPSYVQTEPAELGRMLAKIEQGFDYVASWRAPRVDSKWKQFKSHLFNFITRHLTGVHLHDINSGLRVMRRELAESMPLYADLQLYLPIVAARQGFRVTEIKTRHLEERPRRSGFVHLRRLLDLLTIFFLIRFIQKPFRFFGMLGASSLAIGGLVTCALVIQRLAGVHGPLMSRPAVIFGVLLIVLGVQLFSIGLLGELIIYTHGRKLRGYRIERMYRSEDDS